MGNRVRNVACDMDRCQKIRMVMDKDILDSQKADIIARFCNTCDERLVKQKCPHCGIESVLYVKPVKVPI